MAVVKNDLTREQIQNVMASLGDSVRQKAFDAGSTITYASNGHIVQESSDGTVIVLAPTTAGTTVKVRKKTWKLG